MQPPFQFASLTNRDQRTLAPGSYGTWRVGGAVLTETSTFTSPTYAQLPYSRISLNDDYTLPPYTQDVWDRTHSAPSVSFVVILQNTDVSAVTVNPGVNWVGASFQISGGCCGLLLVLDDGQTATALPVGSAAAIGGSFTVSTTGPLTATSPVVLGGNLALDNTALNSIPTNSWKAGSSSSVGVGGSNVSVGHGASTSQNSAALGYFSSASTNSVGIGYQANATGTDEVAIGFQATAQQDGTIAIGRESSATGTNSMVVGRSGVASADSATGVGQGVQALGADSTAVGRNAFANTNAASVGRDVTGGIDGASFGARSLSRTSGVAVGYQAVNNGVQATNVGRGSTANTDGTALGYQASSGTDASAMGSGSNASAIGTLALGKGSSAGFSYSTAVGAGVATTATNTTLLGNAFSADPTEHVVQSSGYLQSYRQRFGDYSTVDNIVPLGVTYLQFTTIDFEQPAPNSYLIGLETFSFKADTNSTFLVVLRTKAFQPGTSTNCPILFDNQLWYFNASTAVFGLVATETIVRNGVNTGGDNFESTYTLTYIVHTSNTPNDYVKAAVNLIARPGNPSVDFSCSLQIARLN